jgi:hypothetical protein
MPSKKAPNCRTPEVSWTMAQQGALHTFRMQFYRYVAADTILSVVGADLTAQDTKVINDKRSADCTMAELLDRMQFYTDGFALLLKALRAASAAKAASPEKAKKGRPLRIGVLRKAGQPKSVSSQELTQDSGSRIVHGMCDNLAQALEIECTQRQALISVYDSANGDQWKHNDFWCSKHDLSNWYGVTIGEAQTVIALKLDRNRLSGSLSPSVANLGGSLEDLLLNCNSLSGEIPQELGRCKHLKRLWLQENALCGQIPTQIGQCAALVSIDLNCNQLSGAFPKSINQLAQLVHLSVDQNTLTDFPKITKLQKLERYFACASACPKCWPAGPSTNTYTNPDPKPLPSNLPLRPPQVLGLRK